MRSLLFLCSWCCLLLLISAEFSIDDATLFAINFNPGESSAKDGPGPNNLLQPPNIKDVVEENGEGVLSDGEEQHAPKPPPGEGGEEPKAPPPKPIKEDDFMETVIMTSSNHEKYSCRLPRLRGSSASEEEKYTGPSALDILQKLFISQSCAYRLEHYWTYELCHGRYVRQFHEERDGKNVKTTEYYLGKYDSETFHKDRDALNKQIEEGTVRKPHKKRIETMNMPYYELMMTDGTVCDLNGQPRVTRVNYVCYPAGKHEIYSFKESSTCEYDIIVLSSTLCAHPDYRPAESNELEIDCKPLDPATPQKPRNLAQIEEESLKLRTQNRMFEGDFSQGDRPGSVKIEIKPVNPNPAGTAAEDDMDDEELEQHKEENWPRSGRDSRQPLQPLMDPEVVKEFLLGEYCLYGGTGWWKYEFCYGKKVDQYHEERNGKKTVINLGAFDEAAHLKWLEANPGKRPKPAAARKHVSHFYSGGDVCDITKKPRSVEVKLKCKKSDSPSTVSLYLLEPKTCEYILGVESPLVCDILHQADDSTGLVEINRESFGGAQEEDEEAIDEQEKSFLFNADSPMDDDDDAFDGPNPPPPKPVQPPPRQAGDHGIDRHQQEHLQRHMEEHARRAADAAARALEKAAATAAEAGETEEEQRAVLEEAAKLKEKIEEMIRKEAAMASAGSSPTGQRGSKKKQQQLVDEEEYDEMDYDSDDDEIEDRP